MVHNFSWIVPERVGGMARPDGRHADWLKSQGVTAVVSLTERPPTGLEEFSLLHLPVPDMTSPSLDQLHAAVGFMRGVVDEGGAVVVHCTAGMGRTGTALAAYLAAEGIPATESIAIIRALRPGSIETQEQEESIRRYSELMGEGE